MSARACAGLALTLGLGLTGVARADLYYMIVAGLGGEAQYQEQFDKDAASIAAVARRTAGNDRVIVLTGESATRAALEKALESLRKRTKAADSLAVVLVGHGSYDGDAYKFNLPGPDIDGAQLKKLLGAVPAKSQLIVNTTSASGAVLDSWEADGRTLITATRSGSERNATRFAGLFAAALADGAADINKNGAITAQEAFDYASRAVADSFTKEGTLATEHPQLKGGSAARFTVARLGSAAAAPASPEVAALDRRARPARRRDRGAEGTPRATELGRVSGPAAEAARAARRGPGQDRRGPGEDSMTVRQVVAALLLAACAPTASAFTIEYGLDRPAELVACDRILYRGAHADAQACYRKLSVDSEDTRIKADAARAAGDVRGANGFFQAAIKEYPQDARVRVRWGELFLATHQNDEAVKLFQEALDLDKHNAAATLGLAKVAAGRFEEKTLEFAKVVIDENPDDSLEAHLLLARAALEDGSIDDGDKELDRALELAKKHDFPLLEIYALKASADLLRGTTDSPWTKKALALNPGYGEAYATPAYFYVITRRYREAIALLQKAVEIEPDLYSAHEELGVNLLRENKIDEAQQHLMIAYRGDPFSAPVVNTLRLIDSFDNFVVSRHPADTKRPDAVPNQGSILRLNKKEAPVIEPYVLDLVNRTIAAYTKRYNFELKEPVVVELYPQHDDFAVRTSGLPGIGLLGVTFGYLVAMDSPARACGQRFPLGHDAVARDGARVHARGDEPPRAALVQRGRVGVRGMDHGAAARPAHSAAGVQGHQGRQVPTDRRA